MRSVLRLAFVVLSLVGAGAAVAGAPERLPVAAVTIYPGDAITAGLLTEAEFPAGTAQGFAVIGSREELAGKVARRTLLPGRLIARNAVAEPSLIEKGQVVSAVYRSGQLVITASVLALQSGGLADAVQVRNVDSGKVIVGSVQADGTVLIGGGK
jgi:flagella basal body P-ring formation protein FlgA